LNKSREFPTAPSPVAGNVTVAINEKEIPAAHGPVCGNTPFSGLYQVNIALPDGYLDGALRSAKLILVQKRSGSYAGPFSAHIESLENSRSHVSEISISRDLNLLSTPRGGSEAMRRRH